MKKIVFMVALLAILAGCSGGESQQEQGFKDKSDVGEEKI